MVEMVEMVDCGSGTIMVLYYCTVLYTHDYTGARILIYTAVNSATRRSSSGTARSCSSSSSFSLYNQ